MDARARTPSYFSSNSQPWRENGLSTEVASIGGGGGLGAAGPRVHQRVLAVQLLTVQPELHVTALEGSVEVLRRLLGPLVRADVPQLHRAGAVPRGDHAFEIAVIDWVILGHDRQPFDRR